MFDSITPSFLAFALTAVALPFLKGTFLKKSDRCGLSNLPKALAAFLKAIFSLILPFGILLMSILPPDILLLGASLNHEVKCLTSRIC